MLRFLLAVVLAVAVLGCSDGKFNLLLVFWNDSDEPEPSSSSVEGNSSIALQSSSDVVYSSSSEEELYSSPSPSSSSSSVLSSSSRNVRSSSSKEYLDYPGLEAGAQGVEKGWASRYWDGCKPHCSWLDKIGNPKPWRIAKICNIKNEEITTYFKHKDWSDWFWSYEGTISSCDGGEAYTCFDMAPIAINDTLSYGFAARNKSVAECGACYQLEFDGNWQNDPEPRPTHRAIKGKTMIVMVSNTGGLELDQFDIMIPGGGVGDFDSFSNQLGVSKSDLGVTFGGLLTTCERTILPNMGIRDGAWRASLEQWQECLSSECDRVFKGKAKELHNGCLWHVNWLMAANNPTLHYKKVDCPQYLIDKYASSIDTEPPPLPEKDQWPPCLIQGTDCKSTGWYD